MVAMRCNLRWVTGYTNERNCAAGGRVLAHSIGLRHQRGRESSRTELTERKMSARIGKSPESGPVAQLGARFHGMEEVIGSIPIRSTNHFNHLAEPPPTVWQQFGSKFQNCLSAEASTFAFSLLLGRLRHNSFAAVTGVSSRAVPFLAELKQDGSQHLPTPDEWS